MKIYLGSAKELQTLYGFGTSACWWAQAVGDAKTQDEIAELLYGESGLKLNIYRYNIGAGYDKDNCRVENPWRRTQSFMLFDRETEACVWDFNRDKNAVAVMKKCLEKGNIDTLILFCNSPHYSQTSTGQASGSLLYHTCNIPKMNYKKFVDYVLDVTEHFLNEGFPVKYVSPINEPQWKWGGSHVWQEGCHYEIEEITEILHLFAKEIIRRKLPVKLYAPESGEMLGKNEEYLKAMRRDKTLMKVCDIFAYHSYHADNRVEDRYAFKETFVDRYPDIRFDMSEWCELPNKSHTKNFKGALITARIIGQDLIYGGAASWTAWVAANNIYINEKDGNDYSDAMLSGSEHFEEWTINERYWAMAHYSKFIPVGSKALDIGLHPTNEINDFNAFAFRTPTGETVLVIVNEAENREVTISGKYNTMRIIYSSKRTKFAEKYNGRFNPTFESKKNTITTIIVK